RDVGPRTRSEFKLRNGPDPRNRPADEAAAVGSGGTYFFGHGSGVEGEAERLLRDKGRSYWNGPCHRPRFGTVRRDGELHRPGAVLDRHAHVGVVGPGETSVRGPNRSRKVGTAQRVGR